VSELCGGRVHTYTVHPGDLACQQSPEELRGGDAACKAELTLRLLHGEAPAATRHCPPQCGGRLPLALPTRVLPTAYAAQKP